MNTNIFPLPFNVHLIFSCIAFLLFVFQYVKHRRIYQILMAIAIPSTLLLYLNSSRLWYDCIGILELALLIISIVATVIERKKLKAQKAADQAENGEKTEKAE